MIRKIKYIIRNKNRRRSSTEIAKEMKISTTYGNYIISSKRKSREITGNEIDLVSYIKDKYTLSGTERIGKYLNKINIKISKNRIYKILLSLNMVNGSNIKKNQKKYENMRGIMAIHYGILTGLNTIKRRN